MEITSVTSLKDIDLRTVSWTDLANFIAHQAVEIGVKVLVCIIIYIVGRRLIRFLNAVLGKLMNSKKLDLSVISFLNSLINILLTIVLLIIIINILGINNSSFIALFASFGIALGMALSGSMQNLAGGVMILLFRPFKVGDYILAQGQEGTVKSIQIFNTVLVTSDNRTVFVPNGGLSNNVIVNSTSQHTRRIDWSVNVEYGTDYDKAKSLIQDVLFSDKRILKEPKPYIALRTLGEYTVEVLIRVWVKRPDYWDVYFEVNEKIYKTFGANEIKMPSQRLTVRLT
jgi:small conductance mechanosensitive channel